MKMFRTLIVLAAAGSITLSAADLANIATAKRWAPYECTVVQNGKGMTINMPVDHKGGQKEYPIGWPRLYLTKITPAEKDWSKAKALTFKFKLEFTGKSTRYPITLQIRTKGPKDVKEKNHPVAIPGVVNNKEITVTLPLDKIANRDNVTTLGINICERDYKHGENLKFTFSDFKLVEK